MQMWIEPFVVLSEFTQLKKLFIANVPVNWDAYGFSCCSTQHQPWSHSMFMYAVS
jgi:hypothetical protein